MSYSSKKNTILFVVNTAEFFISHRLPIALAAQKEGYKVHVATPNSAFVEDILSHNIEHHDLSISRKGKNFFRELLSLYRIFTLYRSIKPELVHLVTIKPVVYGGIVARILKVPAVVYAVSGIGSAFIDKDLKSRVLLLLIKYLYKLSLGHQNSNLIVQNIDDKDLLLKIIKNKNLKVNLFKGSGVDLDKFSYEPEDVKNGINVVFIGRLIKHKGIFEFLEASTRLLDKNYNANFIVAGEIDLGNPSSLSESEMDQLKQRKGISFLGHRSDISEIIASSNIVVLPSYREGLAKVLAEAAASGRPTITTDVPGCRDAIIQDETGLLVPPRDTNALTDAIETLILNKELRNKLGLSGRLLAKQDFDINKITMQHLLIYKDLLSTPGLNQYQPKE